MKKSALQICFLFLLTLVTFTNIACISSDDAQNATSDEDLNRLYFYVDLEPFPEDIGISEQELNARFQRELAKNKHFAAFSEFDFDETNPRAMVPPMDLVIYGNFTIKRLDFNTYLLTFDFVCQSVKPRLIVRTETLSVMVNNKEATYSPAENMKILEATIDKLLQQASDLLEEQFPPVAAN